MYQNAETRLPIITSSKIPIIKFCTNAVDSVEFQELELIRVWLGECVKSRLIEAECALN